jgi:hypothetical protein
MSIFSVLTAPFVKRQAQTPRTLQEYLRIDPTGRAEMAALAREDLRVALDGRVQEERRFSSAGIADRRASCGATEVSDEARGYAFVLDLVVRLPGERVSEILDKMVGYGQMLQRGRKQ